MKTKTNAEMLKTIKQCNKDAREKRSIGMGFMSSNALINYLQEEIRLGNSSKIYASPFPSKNAPVTPKGVAPAKKSPVKTKVIGEKPTIHIIDIIDKSGSMNGGKDNAAVSGINTGVEQLKRDTAEVDYTYTLCDFSDDIIFRNSLSQLKDANPLRIGTRGSTALYDAIGNSVELVRASAKESDKVLVNIYTDGQENASRKYRSNQIASLIEELSKVGWTFTFIGTKSDVEYAQNNLKFHSSNTLIHDNTEKGIRGAMATNSVSRASYSAKVEQGEDASIGFYKDIN